MRWLWCALGALVWAVLPSADAASAADGPPSSFTLRDPRITESSGLAASRAHPGVYWTHNDSDDGPYVYAVDSATGRTVATVTLSGVNPRDVEAISVARDGSVYVGDIGDNLGGTWPEVWIYRFQEPKELRDTTVTPVRYTVRYEGGPRDAESLAVHPRTGRLYIVSKNEDGGGLYESPKEMSPTGVNTFRRTADIDLWATDAAFSPDGSRLVVRGYFSAVAYRWKAGKPTDVGRPGLPMQHQGESVTFTPDGRYLMYGTEGEGSAVTRVRLRGASLPDSAAKDDGGRASGAARPGDGAQDKGDGHSVGVGALTLAVLAVVLIGGRRLKRRD